ncbi:MAG: MBL fold metallo-hydrolase, partial [Acidimicrobiaceae bacterium]
MSETLNDQLYFRQLLSGRDFAQRDQVAAQMVNFVYLIGDRKTRECIVVDPAYAVDDILNIVEQDSMKLTGVLATHYHPDHVGGSMMGMKIQGVADLIEKTQLPIHINKHEIKWVARTTGLDQNDLVQHEGGDKISVGNVAITFVHTPGHTPGSQCFLVEQRLVAGDTLFLDGCGRTD